MTVISEKAWSKRSAVVSKTKKAKISKDDFEDQIVVSVCGLAYSIVHYSQPLIRASHWTNVLLFQAQ